MLHEVNDSSSWNHGKKTDKDIVIQFLKNKKTVMTKRWNYSQADWVNGAMVTYENVNGVEYLRTVRDASVTDNLDNLIRMKAIA